MIDYKKILQNWNINFFEINKNISFYGSPERSDQRTALTDDKNNIYVLEKINEKIKFKKENIAQKIFELKKTNSDLKINPYLLNKNNNFITEFEDNFWLLSVFIENEKLDREKYLDESWRGKLMANFIIKLNKTSKIFKLKNEEVFSLPKYINKIKKDMIIFHPQEKEQLKNVFIYLEKNFFPIYDNLKTNFCHGDFHPINILWGENEIKSVIDWEFCGFKPEMYDVANMIGCLGMEDPQTLKKDIIKLFLEKIKNENIFQELSWSYLFDLILAIRFSWLAEWLRKNDKEMIELEIIYMNLLLDNKNYLKKFWK